MRKPDGWTVRSVTGKSKYEIDDIARDKKALLENFEHSTNYEIVPVCLVPPELLDWVEKVRGNFLEYLDKYPNDSKSIERIRIEELNRILPEKK